MSEYFTLKFWCQTFALAIHTFAGAAGSWLITAYTSKHFDWNDFAINTLVLTAVSVFASVTSIRVPGTVDGTFIPTANTVSKLFGKEENSAKHRKPED